MEDFLKGRDVDEEVILRFKEEKVDEDVIKLMSDEDLIKLGLTSMGDRIAVRTFVNASHTISDQRQSSLIDRVKEKLRHTSKKSRWESLKSNKHAKTELRSVEFGWMNKDQTGLKQVRTRTGGGTRHVKVERNTTVLQLKQMAAELFFPNGSSKQRGQVSDYKLSMVNFDCSYLSEKETVHELYCKTAHRILRLYLLTERNDLIDALSDASPADCQDVSDEAPIASTSTSIGIQSISTDVNSLHDDEAPVKKRLVNIESSATPEASVVDTEKSPEMVLPETQHIVIDDNVATEIVLETSTMQNSFDDEIFFNYLPQKQVVWLHRGMVLNELEDFFIKNEFDVNHNMLAVKLISPNGVVEEAEDSGGVLRDVLSEYWSSFYEKKTMGRDLKVPVLSHAVDGSRWKASAKILYVGYYLQDYFPVKLASCFLEYVVSGDNIDSNLLLDQFVNNFLPSSEMEIAQKALGDFDSVDVDDLLDFLTDHGCKSVPRKENMRKIILEIGHKEMIQAPTYVADNWKEHLSECLSVMKTRGTNFSEMSKKIPTFKEVWKSICIAEDANKDVAGYLKKFLKEIDTSQMKNFLRFCTGADVIVSKTITVRTFTPESDFLRRPVAHTCGCLLELPDSYLTFLDFRAEVNGVLNSGVWIMDIV